MHNFLYGRGNKIRLEHSHGSLAGTVIDIRTHAALYMHKRDCAHAIHILSFNLLAIEETQNVHIVWPPRSHLAIVSL